MAIAVPPSQYMPLPWQGKMSPHGHLVLIPACSLGKSCASSGEKAARSFANTNYDLYLLSWETLSLLHPNVLLLIFTGNTDNSSQSAWKHYTAPAIPCTGSSQHNPTRNNNSLFWLCLGQWVSWCLDNTLVATIMFASMDKSGWAVSLWSCGYNPPDLGALSASEKPLWCKKQGDLEWKGQDHCSKAEF